MKDQIHPAGGAWVKIKSLEKIIGRGQARKRKFLEEHPICCFCGGSAPAVTIDHIPSRSLFNGRQWPEGYEFPACQSCNSITARQEQVIALLARMGNPNPTEQESAEFQTQLEGVSRNLPHVLNELRPSSNQVRSFLKNRGLKLGQGLSTRDVPILSVRGPLAVAAVDDFARKLFLALHYRHTEIIVPKAGGIALKWITNATPDDAKILIMLDNIRQQMPHMPRLQRSNTRLENQFSYKYITNALGDFSAYFVVVRHAFAMLGVVQTNTLEFPDVMQGDGILRPF